MRTYDECHPCFLRQAREASRLSTPDTTLQATALHQAQLILSRLDHRMPPPLLAYFVYNIIKETTHCTDPYLHHKRRSNNIALRLYPWATSLVKDSSRPLDTALRLACAGNVIDFGTATRYDLGQTLHEIMKKGFTVDRSELLLKRLESARSLLYLGDNAGEIVFDRLLIETLAEWKPELVCTYAVRGGPVINDITMRDALMVSMNETAGIISSGCPAPGAVLPLCSDRFLNAYRAADVIIAKGQGNYEALSSERDDRIFFILRVKCEVVARHLRAPTGSFMLTQPEGVF